MRGRSRYPRVPRAETAGYGCEAGLRRLDRVPAREAPKRVLASGGLGNRSAGLQARVCAGTELVCRHSLIGRQRPQHRQERSRRDDRSVPEAAQ